MSTSCYFLTLRAARVRWEWHALLKAQPAELEGATFARNAMQAVDGKGMAVAVARVLRIVRGKAL